MLNSRGRDRGQIKCLWWVLAACMFALIGCNGCRNASLDSKDSTVENAISGSSEISTSDDVDASGDRRRSSTRDSNSQQLAEDAAETLRSEASSVNSLVSVDSESPELPGSTPNLNSESPDTEPNPESFLQEGSWTVQRLIVLAKEGPMIIELMVQIGREDMDSASRLAVEPICEGIMSELGEEATWKQLLDHPLVRSGWLGNIVAQDDQLQQVTQMVDANRDGVVQTTELAMFLSRGLARLEPIRFRDAGVDSSSEFSSPWGPLDRDSNHLLDKAEIDSAVSTLLSLDYDGDSNISLAEITPQSQPNAMMSRQPARSMLPVSTVVVESDLERREDESKLAKLRQRKATEILQYYSYLEAVDRDQWSGWSDDQWAEVDKSKNERLDSRELVGLFTVEPLARVALRIPAISVGEMSAPEWFFSTSFDHWQPEWKTAALSASLSTPNFNLLISFDDSFGDSFRRIIFAQLDSALRNAQIKAFIASQLQLSERAFDLADSDGDHRLSEQEFTQVWQWLGSRQSGRLQAQWTLASQPWFQLLDLDMNRRVSHWEVSQAGSLFEALDQNSDGQISNDEMPLVVQLQLRRTDDRPKICP